MLQMLQFKQLHRANLLLASLGRTLQQSTNLNECDKDISNFLSERTNISYIGAWKIMTVTQDAHPVLVPDYLVFKLQVY